MAEPPPITPEQDLAAIGLRVAAANVSKALLEYEKWLVAGYGAALALTLPKADDLLRVFDGAHVVWAAALLGFALLLSVFVLFFGAQVVASAGTAEEAEKLLPALLAKVKAARRPFDFDVFHKEQLRGLWWPGSWGAKYGFRHARSGDYGASARLIAKLSQLQTYLLILQVVLGLAAGAALATGLLAKPGVAAPEVRAPAAASTSASAISNAAAHEPAALALGGANSINPSPTLWWLQFAFSALAIVTAIAIPTVGAWLTRKRVRRGHFETIALDVRVAERQARVYLNSPMLVPAYRLPLHGFETSLPALLADGRLSAPEAVALEQFYIDATSFNFCLDLAQELRQQGGKDISKEVTRIRAKANHLIPEGKLSRYGAAMDVLTRHLPARDLARLELDAPTPEDEIDEK